MVPGLRALGAKMSPLGELSAGCMEPTYRYHVHFCGFPEVISPSMDGLLRYTAVATDIAIADWKVHRDLLMFY